MAGDCIETDLLHYEDLIEANGEELAFGGVVFKMDFGPWHAGEMSDSVWIRFHKSTIESFAYGEDSPQKTCGIKLATKEAVEMVELDELMKTMFDIKREVVYNKDLNCWFHVSKNDANDLFGPFMHWLNAARDAVAPYNNREPIREL